MVLIDANVILRYLLRDQAEQANQAAALIHAGAWTTPGIMAEVVYVMQGLYQIPRDKIASALLLLLHELHMEETALLSCALDIYQKHKLDFTDCLLAARALTQGAQVFTFDKKLMKTIAELLGKH